MNNIMTKFDINHPMAQKAFTLATASGDPDPLSFTKQMFLESGGWKPRARSHKGAMGIGQLMPGTAKDMGVIDPYDAEQSMLGALKYRKWLRTALKKEGYDPKEQAVLAAYNGGIGNYTKYKGNIPFKETQSYVHLLSGAPPPAPAGQPASGVSNYLPPDGMPSHQLHVSVRTPQPPEPEPIKGRTQMALPTSMEGFYGNLRSRFLGQAYGGSA